MTTLMTTSRTALGGLLALALAPAFWPGDAAAHTCDDPFRTDLVTARGIDVGEITVCNDADVLTVTYETTFPWCVLRTNLHVASDLAGIPQTRLGTPNWLRFDFIEDVDCQGEVAFDIPLDEIDGGVLPGDSVVVAARAVVEGERPDGTHPRCLLGDKCVAWGEGTRFRPRLPAMYFEYTVQQPPPACPCAGNVDQVLREWRVVGASVDFHGVLGAYFVDGTCMPTAGNLIPGHFGFILIDPTLCALQGQAFTPFSVGNACASLSIPRDTSRTPLTRRSRSRWHRASSRSASTTRSRLLGTYSRRNRRWGCSRSSTSLTNPAAPMARTRAAAFIGLWEGVDEDDGSLAQRAVTCEEDRTCRVLGAEQSFSTCDDHGGRGMIVGTGTIEDGVLNVPALTLTCPDGASFTLAAVYSLDRGNGTPLEDTEGEPATLILHRLSPRVESRR